MLSAILTGMRRITTWDLQWSAFLEHNVRRYMEAIGLDYVQNGARGIQFRRRDNEHDIRVTRAFGRRRLMWSDDEATPHLLRTVCRARALETTTKTRHDAEGVNNIDLEANSRKPWQAYRDGLSAAEGSFLEIYRCGAIATQTRLFEKEHRPDDLCICDHCGEQVWASMRHLMVECEGSTTERRMINRTFNIDDDWWQRQPRVTTKTGWITYEADRDGDRRSTLQVATCRLAMMIITRNYDDRRRKRDTELR